MPEKEKPVVKKVNNFCLVNIIIGVLLVVSIGFNVYFLITCCSKTANSRTEKNSSKTYKGSKYWQKPSDERGHQKGDTKDKDNSSNRNVEGEVLTEEKVLELLNTKRKKMGVTDWSITDIDIKGHNEKHTIYYVTYDARDKEGKETKNLIVIMKYKKAGVWDFNLPGTSRANVDFFKRYNLIKDED